MLTSPIFRDLSSLMERYRVRYLVVGGHAVMRYTEPRFTKDLDLWISTDSENARAVFAALREFGAPLADMTASDFMQEGYVYQMGQPPFRLDVMMSIDGVTFEDAWKRRESVSIEGFSVPFICKADLIRNKEASGRPQDLIDAENLRKADHT